MSTYTTPTLPSSPPADPATSPTPYTPQQPLPSVEQSPLHQLDFEQKGSSSMLQKRSAIVLFAVVSVVAGISTGLGVSKLQSKSTGSSLGGGNQQIQQVAGDTVRAGDVFGVQDEKTFKDSAEGYLELGGLHGEGSHSLLRAGGASQTVYLTSSVTDLAKFEGMQIKVWGETFKGQKAGWLMDVGRVQVVNPQGQAPASE